MTRTESTVDVLIVGAGPAGLIAATWMAKCGIKTRIVEQRPYRLRVGGADGINPRSMEIFESFGFVQEVSRLWEPITSWAAWSRDAKGNFEKIPHSDSPTSFRTKYSPGLLQQGVIEKIMKHHLEGSLVQLEYETAPTSLYIKEGEVDDPDAHPCVLTLRNQAKELHDSTHWSTEEVIRAKYVIGADGARSWMRNQLGFSMEGAQTRSVWAVADLVVESDFPDIRTCTTVNTFGGRGLFFLHRERGLTRFYVQLNRADEEGIPKESVTQDLIIQSLRHFLRPYMITVKHCEWWSSYTIGHYLSSGMSKNNRIFLVGDAVHNHSPLVGLGMNVSMQDSYNLGWKLAGVVKKELNPKVLSTFETERRPVAETLISTDRFHLDLVDTMSTEGSEPAWMQQRSLELEPFLQGFSADYQDSFLTATPQKTPKILDCVVPGRRFPELAVSDHVTGKPSSILSLCQTDGKFHIVVFAGDIAQQKELDRFNEFGLALQKIEEHVLPLSSRVLDLLVVHRASRSAAVQGDLTKTFYPARWTKEQGSNQIYCDMDGSYEAAGMEPGGSVVVIRPDQHVGWCGGLADVQSLEDYLSFIFVP